MYMAATNGSRGVKKWALKTSTSTLFTRTKSMITANCSRIGIFHEKTTPKAKKMAARTQATASAVSTSEGCCRK